MFLASAPGKLILLGEHSVVYGHRAIAAAVSLSTRVHLKPQGGPTTLIGSAIDDPRLEEALSLALPERGFGVEIYTDLPVGRGMGSSAALAIALLRAGDMARGEVSSFASLYQRGFELERLFHGNPSGLDHAVSALGGALVYRKGQQPEPVRMPPTQVVVLDTRLAGDTAQLVAGVASRRPRVDPHLEALGDLVEQALLVLDDPIALGAMMNEAQTHLRAIGVSSPEIEVLVELALANGASGAKLSGAGGGGVVLALTPHGSHDLLEAAAARGIQAFACTLPER
ncbi:MAG: mevalonate kinase [Myxococcota bacterium]|nr:mevalonate kinase [Myxococcota bacterium]